MMGQTSIPPSLSIDLKKNRIRIHKRTLQLLGNPEYIQLLVNPANAMIAIRRSNRKDYLALKARRNASESVEFYSSGLIENLMTVNDKLVWNSTYRIYGSIDTHTGMAVFSMCELILVEGSEE